ncbi:MAG: hypothetical protein H6845_01215 [Alphaproteobacteria bacterium]|nr:MAG: hypothetical protein H6845_01215 [Alphaproteobacteria bacterium]
MALLNKYAYLLDVPSLTFNDKLFSFLMKEKNRGVRVVLATGSPVKIGNMVDLHLGNFFDKVIGSIDKTLISTNKLLAIREYLSHVSGERKFLYIGDSVQDLAVWSGADFKALVGDLRIAKEYGVNFDIIF